MNIHERIGDCTVILINCTLNPVEMDHQAMEKGHYFALARARACI